MTTINVSVFIGRNHYARFQALLGVALLAHRLLDTTFEPPQLIQSSDKTP